MTKTAKIAITIPHDDLAAAEERVREAERELEVIGGERPVHGEQPRRFAHYDDFVAWRRARPDHD